MTRPEVVMHSEDYKTWSQLVLRDIKARWAIHQYEVTQLTEDVKKLTEFVKPFIQQSVEYVKDSYQREFGPKTTV